jgi:glycosyltransferase involved in cell wall biosynthesis
MKFKSVENRYLEDEIEIQNSKYRIKVKLPQGKATYNLPFTNVSLEILYELKPHISDSDSIQRKKEIKVTTSARMNDLMKIRNSNLEVSSEVVSNNLHILIESEVIIFLDVKWIRDLLMSYASVEDFQITEFTNSLQFLLSSVSNRMPGSMEVLDSKFAFSLKDFNKFQSETKVNQIIFSDHSFEADQNRTILGKRILLVSHEDSYTGAPLYLLQLANYLRNRGLEVIILCVRAKFKSGVFSSQGFKTVYIEDLSAEELLIRDWLLTDLGKTLVSDLILGLAPDQIWVNSINASCVIDLVDRLNITSCLFVHESFGFMSKNTLANEYEVMFRSSLEKAHLVVFGSEHSKSSFYQNEIRTNGIVLNSLRTNDSSVQNLSLEKRVSRRKEMGINPAAIVFLSMATFELRKRIGDIIDAFENSAPPNSYLILVGYVQEDRHSSHLKKRVDGKSNVLVFPVSKDPSYFYSISDVLVLASQSETYPLVLQEAIHWDLLRIVSKYPGYGASCNEETALMFEVGDLDQLKSLMTKSATHLQSSQLVKKAAKSDFSKKEEFYSDKLISILTNLSIVSVGLEDL